MLCSPPASWVAVTRGGQSPPAVRARSKGLALTWLRWRGIVDTADAAVLLRMYSIHVCVCVCAQSHLPLRCGDKVLDVGKSIRESDCAHSEASLFQPAISLIKHIYKTSNCLISATVSQ